MKKYLFILASAALLVFAFSAVAGAKYAGYAVDGMLASNTATTSAAPGYLSWGGATHLMGKNNASATVNGVNIEASAHGAYVTTTTKCAVCHSVHRATGLGVITTATTSNQNGTVNQFLTAGGASCVQCHTAWGATPAALIVEWANPETAAGPHSSRGGCSACHAGGIHGTGTSNYGAMNVFMLGNASDTQLAAELPLQLGTTYTGTAATWFNTGTTGPATLGGMPAGLNAAQFATARSIATGYTCARTGCHVNSVFANVQWGQTYQREQRGAGTGFMATTGHTTDPGAGSNHTGTGCGPCHPGNAAGGYRFVASTQHPTAAAYGCDQCHDLVGVATNSTAFPHGNRAIDVYQWDKTDAISVLPNIDSGNLWMYASNMSSTSTAIGNTIDKSFQLIQGAVGPDATGNVGNIVDGVCLKCHVPFDSASATASGAAAGTNLTATNHGRPSATAIAAGTTTGLNTTFRSPNFMYTWF